MAKRKEKYQWRRGERPPLIEPHSLAKHQVLKAYIRTYIRVVMANVNIERLVFSVVDAFADGGEYRTPEGGICEGSPFICLEAAREAEVALNLGREKPRTVDARFYFIEKDPSSFDYLTAYLDTLGAHRHHQVQTLKGDFAELAEQVITDIKRRCGGERALFVLDQYAYDDVPMLLLRRIFDRVEKAEVLLTFNVDSLVTYLTDSPAHRGILERVGLAKYVDWGLVTAIGKATNPNWRVVIQKMLAQGIIAESGAQFATIFFIRPLGSRGWTYWLVHLSRVFKARDVMMSIHWDLANHFVHHLEPDIFTLGFDASRDPEATRQQILSLGEEFTFDTEAERKCREGLTDKLTRSLFDDARPVVFNQLLHDLANRTPATADMIRRSFEQPLACRDIEVRGEDGERRKKANAIRANDVIRPAKQRRFFF